MRKEQENHRRRLLKGRNVWGKAFWLTLCLVFMMCSSGDALWIGQSQINPFLEVQGVYETNVFRVSSDEEEDSDFLTVVSPGIHLEIPTTQDSVFRLISNYRADIQFYTNNGDSEIDPDEELNTISHRFDGELRLKFASGFRFKTGYILDATSNPPDFRGDTRDAYLNHRFLAQIAYAFADRYEVQLQYDGAMRSYSDSDNEADDYMQHGVEAIMFFKIFPKLSILGGGGYTMIDREEPLFSDSNEYTGFGGLRYEVTEDLTGTLKVGVISKDFDEEALDDVTNVYASGLLNAEFSESTSLFAELYRRLDETSVSDESDIYGAYYITTGLSAQISHTLGALPNMTLSGKFSYSHEEYPEDVDDRSDDNLEVGLGIDYKLFKYFVIGTNYTYSATDSSIDTNDFGDNIISMKLRALM